jgi:ankyrin repeat protein
MSYTTPLNNSNSSTKVSMKRKRPITGNIIDQVSTSLLPRKVVRVMSALPVRHQKHDDTSSNPQHCLESILAERGIQNTVHSYDSLTGFFEETKDEEVKAYGLDVLKAIRDSDIEQLRAFHQQGRPLKCSNRFGESLLHLACRKGLLTVVDFLINEVGVPVNVVDDMGRNPLHDAFWTIEPNLELVDVLVKQCPDLLLVSDKRGHTPFSYARRSHWSKWVTYLKERSNLLAPTLLNQPKQ